MFKKVKSFKVKAGDNTGMLHNRRPAMSEEAMVLPLLVIP